MARCHGDIVGPRRAELGAAVTGLWARPLTGKVARAASAVLGGDEAVSAETRSDVADAGPPASERMAVPAAATAARTVTVLLVFKPTRHPARGSEYK